MSHFMIHLYESYYMTLPATLDMNNQAKRIQKGWYRIHSFFVLFTVSIKLLAGSRDPRIKTKLSRTKRTERFSIVLGPDQTRINKHLKTSSNSGWSVHGSLARWTSNCNRNQPDLLSIQQLVRPTSVHANWNKLVTYNDEYHRVNWGAWFRWSLTLDCPMRNAGQITIVRTHPRLNGVWFRPNSKWSEATWS